MAKFPLRSPTETVHGLISRKPIEREGALTELIEGVAHELNNSVAIALGHVQLLKLKNHDDKVTEGLNRIEKSVLKCAGIIKSIQNYAGRAEHRRETTIKLSEALTAALDNDETGWKELASQKNLSIFANILSGDVLISADLIDLVTAISQLIHNAVDASPNRKSIEITIKALNKLAILSISDSGPGISDEIKFKIYEPFFSSKGVKGSGLGLTIVQSIVSRYGGRVGFMPNAPTGTVFNISFPLQEAKAMDSDCRQNDKEESSKRILIVDDDEEIRNVLGDMLRMEGIQAEKCADPYGAMELLEKNTYYMVITDLGMPGMSGYDLAEYVHDKYKNVGIVLLTGWGNIAKKEGRKLKGVKGVLTKPFHLNQVLELVRN